MVDWSIVRLTGKMLVKFHHDSHILTMLLSIALKNIYAALAGLVKKSNIENGYCWEVALFTGLGARDI